MAAEVTEGTSDDTHLAADSKRQENAAGCSGYPPPVQEDTRHMAANLPKSTSDDSHLAGDSTQSENKHFDERNMMQQIELVGMNGELLTTFKREDLVYLTVEGLIEHLEEDWVTGADGAKTDDLGVLLERFSLVIRNEVFRRTMRTPRTMGLVTDYFPEGEESIQITLIKEPREETSYKQLRRHLVMLRERRRDQHLDA